MWSPMNTFNIIRRYKFMILAGVTEDNLSAANVIYMSYT
jgi:hypothetical protein